MYISEGLSKYNTVSIPCNRMLASLKMILVDYYTLIWKGFPYIKYRTMCIVG